MKKCVMAAVLASLAFSHTVLAEQGTPVYRDNVLTIPSGVIIDDSGVTPVRGVTLIQEEDGRFSVTGADDGLLADVDAVTLDVVGDHNERVRVTATGYQSSACVDILEPAIVRDGNVFSVILSESAQWSDVCILIMKSYEKTLYLDVRGLDSGTYVVDVNGVESEFTL